MRLSGDARSDDPHKVADLSGEPFWIGRNDDCDWSIQDSGGLVSRRHCMLRIDGDALLLTDFSTNGTSVDNRRAFLVRETPTPLAKRTTVYLCGTDVRIDIECNDLDDSAASGQDDDFWQIDEALSRDRAPPSRQPVPAEDRLAAAGDDWLSDDGGLPGDTGLSPPRVSTGTQSPFPAPSSGEASDPFDAVGPATPPSMAAVPAPQTPSTTTANTHDPFGAAPAPSPPPPPPAPEAPVFPTSMPTPAPPPAPVPTPDRGPGVAAADAGALAPLFEGMGIDPASLSIDDMNAALREIGATHRAMAEALRVALASRRDVKLAFGQPSTQLEFGANPLKLSIGADDALLGLVQPRGSGYLHGTAAVEEASADLQRHQMALLGAVKIALKAGVAAFDPDALENKIEKRGIGAVLPAMRQAALWTKFVDHYHEFAEAADDDMRRVIGKELDTLYRSGPRPRPQEEGDSLL